MMKEDKFNFIVPKNAVNAAHWYDVATLGKKQAMLLGNFDRRTGKIVVGKKNIQKMFISQLKTIKDVAKSIQGGIPTLIGEFGVPYDLNKKEAYGKYKTEPETAWDSHINALTMYYNAIDANLLHSTQWNYTADNNNKWGDLWNLEDLSIFSRDQQLNPNDINSGGRAIKGFCRPYIICCAGIPLKMEFDIEEGTFYFDFDGNPSINAPSILYIPKIQYPKGFEIIISEGEIEKREDEQLVYIKSKTEGIHTIKIIKKA